MLIAVPDDYPFARIGDIAELKIQHFSWPESAMQHEEEHGPVPLEPQRSKEFVKLVVIHRMRETLGCLHMYCPTDGALPGNSAHERTMPFRHTRQRRIIDLVNGIFVGGKLAGENEILVEGRDGSNDAIDRRRRQARTSSSLSSRGREREPKALRLVATGKCAQILQEGQRLCWGKLLIGEFLRGQKGQKVQQIIDVGGKRLG